MYVFFARRQGTVLAVASWLVRLSLDRAVRVRTLAGRVVYLGKTLYFHSASLYPGV